MLGKCRVPSCQQVQMHGAIGFDNAGGIVFHASRDVLEDLVQMAVAQAPELHDPPDAAGAKRSSPSATFLLKSEMEVLPGRWATTTPFVFASCESKPALNII